MRDAKVKKVLIVLFVITLLLVIYIFRSHKPLHRCHGDDLHCYYKTAQKYIDKHDYIKAARVYEAGCNHGIPERQICRLQNRLEKLIEKQRLCYSGYSKECRAAALTFLYWQQDVGYDIIHKHQAEIRLLLLQGCRDGDAESCVMRESGLLLYKNRFDTYQHSRY